MKAAIPVVTKTLVFGVDIDRANKAELISIIVEAKARKKELAEANEGVSSTYLASQIEALDGAIDLAKAKLDGAAPAAAPAE